VQNVLSYFFRLFFRFCIDSLTIRESTSAESGWGGTTFFRAAERRATKKSLIVASFKMNFRTPVATTRSNVRSSTLGGTARFFAFGREVCLAVFGNGVAMYCKNKVSGRGRRGNSPKG
jgi:hypothetical protein